MLKDSSRNEIIRAGATYPTAVPSSYFQPPENPWPTCRGLRQRVALTSNKNTRPRPAFGATRDEGGIGPIEALSPYADAVDCNRRNRKSVYLRGGGRGATAPPQGPLETVAKGPTADKIISMTAAGKKPPVPDAGQIKKQREYLDKISLDMAAVVSRFLSDENKTCESISFDTRNTGVLSNRISGYGFHQTWGVTFSREDFTP